MLSGRFFRRCLKQASGEPAMNAMLVAALMSACVVNVACLVGHLVAGA
jgi:hypothetical protein